MARDQGDSSNAAWIVRLFAVVILTALFVLLFFDLCLRRWWKLRTFKHLEKHHVVGVCTARLALVAGMLYAVFLICAFALAQDPVTDRLVSASFISQLLGLQLAHLSQSFSVTFLGRTMGWSPGQKIGWCSISCSLTCTMVSMIVAMLTNGRAVRQWQGILLISINAATEVVNSVFGVAVLHPKKPCKRHSTAIVTATARCRKCWWISIRTNADVFVAFALRPLTILPFAFWVLIYSAPVESRSKGRTGILASVVCGSMHTMTRTLLSEGWGGFGWRMWRRMRHKSQSTDRAQSNCLAGSPFGETATSISTGGVDNESRVEANEMIR